MLKFVLFCRTTAGEVTAQISRQASVWKIFTIDDSSIVNNDKKTSPKPQKQALKNVKVTKKSSKQMSTFSCEKCHQRPLAEFCLFSKFSGTFDDLHCPPLVWARSDGR